MRRSRTLLTEVQVDNPTGVLLPGMYAQLRFVAQRADPPFLVPDAALVVRATGTMLAVLEPLAPSKTRPRADRSGDRSGDLPAFGASILWHVQPGRDYGTELEILHGLQAGEEVVVDPGDAVQEGALVQTWRRSREANLDAMPGSK